MSDMVGNTARHDSTAAHDRAVADMLAARYGTRRRRGVWIASGVLVAAYLVAAAWASLALSANSVEGNVLAWRAQPREVEVALEVRGSAPDGADCVIKATDARATDVGYRTVRLDRAPSTQTVVIPTVIAAGSVTVLACGPPGEPLRVPPPDFPPGVAIP